MSFRGFFGWVFTLGLFGACAKATSVPPSFADGGGIYKGHSQAVVGVAWSPDGKQIASASDDGTVQVWDSASGQRLAEDSSHTNVVWTVAWSPDGKRLASASQDGTVSVWQP